MMKNYCLAVLLFFLASCTNTERGLIGRWRLDSIILKTGKEKVDRGGTTIDFKSDGTYDYSNVTRDLITEIKGTYIIVGNNLKADSLQLLVLITPPFIVASGDTVKHYEVYQMRYSHNRDVLMLEHESQLIMKEDTLPSRYFNRIDLYVRE
jgi:hypothetical protein